MDSKTNYFGLGLFVVTSVVIALVAIATLIGPDFFKPHAKVETYFKFSISGLEVGAPVKFRGIQVGQVDEILLSTEAYPKQSEEILSQTKAVAVVRMKLGLADQDVKEQLQAYIDHGLRIQTQLAGITGSLYLSIDFLDPSKYPADRIPYTWKPKYLVIPSAPSLSNEIVENVKEFLASLDSLHINKNLQETVPVFQSLVANLERIADGINPESFNTIGSSLSNLLGQADTKISELDIQQLNDLIKQLEQSAASIEDLSKRTETRQLITNLTNLSRNLNQVISNNGYDINVIVANLTKIAENLNNLSSGIPAAAANFFNPRPATIAPFKSKE